MDYDFDLLPGCNKVASSIMQFNPGEQCVFCKTEHGELVLYDVLHDTGRSDLSWKYGLWVTVCPSCHDFILRYPLNPRVIELCQQAQHQAMHKYGWSVQDFIKIFGKNYI